MSRLSSAKSGLRFILHEVSPRDGLQNERQILSTVQKLDLIESIARFNPASIEVTSFVRGDAVPALADMRMLFARSYLIRNGQTKPVSTA